MSNSELTIRRVLSDDDWKKVKEIRTEVFIEEQACPPEEEWDKYDHPDIRYSSCRHFLGSWNGVDVATARWHETAVERQPAARLERFAVLEVGRGYGFGRSMIEHLMHDARMAGFSTLVLHAQAYLTHLYESLGFRQIGQTFNEAGIPHVRMTATMDG